MKIFLALATFLTTFIISGDFQTNESISSQDDKTEMIDLSELFNNQAKYGNEMVIIKGVVVKVNPNIMGKNWIHIQDGTKNDEGELHDLTITSEDEFKVDQEVIVKGKITLDKDLGAGYFFEVIMEEGKLYKKKI